MVIPMGGGKCHHVWAGADGATRISFFILLENSLVLAPCRMRVTRASRLLHETVEAGVGWTASKLGNGTAP